MRRSASLPFPNVFADAESLIHNDSIVVVSGKITVSAQSGIELVAEKISAFVPDDAFFEGKQLYVKIAQDTPCDVDGLVHITSRYPGNSSVVVYVEKTGQKYKLTGGRSVAYRADLLDELKGYLGAENVVVK